MKRRNPLVVFLLSLITCGIYDIYWLVKTKKELNSKTGVHTPTIWLLFLPPFIGVALITVLMLVMSSNATTSTGASTGRAGVSLLAILAMPLILLVVVIISFYWFFKFSKAINEYTNEKMSTGIAFVLLWVVRAIGIAIVQDAFNDTIEADNTFTPPAPASVPSMAGPIPAPVSPAMQPVVSSAVVAPSIVDVMPPTPVQPPAEASPEPQQTATITPNVTPSEAPVSPQFQPEASVHSEPVTNSNASALSQDQAISDNGYDQSSQN